MHGIGRVLQFFRLSSAERKLFVTALFYLALMRGALYVVRFRVLWGWLESKGMLHSIHNQYQSSISTNQIALALNRAAPRVPGTTCLTKALAGAVLMSRHGYPANLCIGVTKDEGEFGAHAWVECEGKPIIGSKAHFNTLLILEGAEQ